MQRFGAMIGAAATLALFGATAAHAQTFRTQQPIVAPASLQTPDAPNLSQPFQVPTPTKTLQLDSHGHWGLRLDLTKPVDRPADWKDVEAGAYIKLTPRLRVGGSVGLGDKLADPQHLTPAETAAPRVHLETSFKF